MSADAEAAVATFLAAAPQSLTNVFKGEEKPSDSAIPAASVFVQGYDGPSPRPVFGSTSIYAPHVQVKIRAAQDDYAAGRARAISIMTMLHRASLSGYVSCLLIGSGPRYIGVNKAGEPRWTVSVELLVSQA